MARCGWRSGVALGRTNQVAHRNREDNMQAVKDKINEMGAMRKVKAEARAEEKAEKEIAKTRAEVAHEVRLAKEAEATMSLHVARAGEIARAGEKAADEARMEARGQSDDTTKAKEALPSSGMASAGPAPPANYHPMS